MGGQSDPTFRNEPETDTIFPVAKRHETEQILAEEVKQPYQISLYSDVAHGFAVRGDVKVRAQRYAKEMAFLQAVFFFEEWIKR